MKDPQALSTWGGVHSAPEISEGSHSTFKGGQSEILLSISLTQLWWKNLADSNTNPNKNKSAAVPTALIPLTAFQPVPLKVITGYKYAGYRG